MVLASNCQTAQILPPSQSVHSLRFLIAVLKLEIDDLQAKGIWPMTTWRVLGLRADNDGKLPTVIIVIVLDDETQGNCEKFFFYFLLGYMSIPTASLAAINAPSGVPNGFVVTEKSSTKLSKNFQSCPP